jgi:hypothetical protein
MSFFLKDRCRPDGVAAAVRIQVCCRRSPLIRGVEKVVAGDNVGVLKKGLKYESILDVFDASDPIFPA